MLYYPFPEKKNVESKDIELFFKVTMTLSLFIMGHVSGSEKKSKRNSSRLVLSNVQI